MACCSCKWHLFSSLLSNLLCLSQHTIGVFSHVHTDVDNQAHERILLCHFTYILSSAARRWNLKKPTTFILKRQWHCGGNSELQELLVVLFWANLIAFVFSSELLSCVDTGLTTLWKQLRLVASLRHLFASQILSSDSHFRKTLQVRIIHHCCFYAIRASLFVFHECGRIKFSVEECINESHSCLHLQIDSTVHL